ncbi:formate dehydrogenase subunit gamma [Methylomarinovum caldicuralii]|nr:formate dehydrogenase subunit gamma [Methylomarinovum caldicuralii]
MSSTRSRRLWQVTGLALLLLSVGLVAATVDWSNPRAELWRQVREGVEGYSAVRGLESGELIQASGEVWRGWRNGPLSWAGGLVLGGVALVLGLFHLLHGPQRLEKPRTGIKVPRWSLGERVLHWTTATLFIVLSLTGLSLLYGRRLLIPLIGHQTFSAYLAVAKFAHNLIGPLFVACLIVMGLIWFRDNLWQRIDWDWFKSFGGLFGGGHPHAGRMNAGEKAWFWLLMTVGAVVSVTGLLLDLPLFGLERESLQLSHILHVAAALIVMAAALGHIYIGTVGTEGALEGMISGKVDLSWVRQHHDLWLEELQQAGRLPRQGERPKVERHAHFFRPDAD